MLRIFDTLTRQVKPIEPAEPGHVKMYSCGPTVYRYVHVGNLRTFLLADLIRRVLSYHDLSVHAVMNITDVGHMTDELSDAGRDRMLLAAEDEGRSPEEIAAFYTDAFLADCDALNIHRFDAYPKASGHIPQMIEVVSKLLERGLAYEKEGTVYFDVSTFPDYGRLSGHALDDMRAGHRVEVDAEKRNHQDFLLWKAAGPRRLVVFDSPWGLGYPGWHIECSAMSMHLLGDRIDVHTGGVDNIFPHHEDEIAQSEGAVGHTVVDTWVHGEHLLMGQAKMAKSAGNIVRIGDLAAAGHDPLAFRYLCFTSRYRRQVHFAEDALAAAGTALRRLRERVTTLGRDGAGPATDSGLREAVRDERALAAQERFMSALDDDLDLPQVLTILHEMLGDERIPAGDRSTLARSWDHVLGLDLAPAAGLSPDLEALVHEREQARTDKDFTRADAIRDRLRDAGFDLIDTETGTRWIRTR